MSCYHPCFKEKQPKAKKSVSQTKSSINVTSLMLLKLNELLKKDIEPGQKKLLPDSIRKDIDRIKNPDMLFSDKNFSAFILCFRHPDLGFWDQCENKLLDLLKKFSVNGFFSSEINRNLLLHAFPSEKITNKVNALNKKI